MKPPHTIAAVILTALLPIAVLSQSAKNESQQFVGDYSYWFSFGGSSIKLQEDGTFQQDSGSCTFTTQERGTYIFADGKLHFTILKYTGRQNGDSKDVDLFDNKLRAKFYGYEEDGKDTPLKTEFVLYPVTWGERVYLIYESDLDDFTDAINLGLEPREFSPQDTYYGSFLLRDGDEQKKTRGVPGLPSKYTDRLLSKPITATIVSVETVGKDQVATIDQGRLAGVKVGMRFVEKHQRPEPWSKEGIVLSVDDTSARVRASGRLVGDVLTTKAERKDRFQ